MTTIVIDLQPYEGLLILGAILLGIGIGYVLASWHITDRVNAQWFAERERVHQERKDIEEFIRLHAAKVE